MWWVVGGIFIAAAAVRWHTGRNGAETPLERADRVQRGYAAVRSGRPVAIASASDGPVVLRGKVSAEETPLVTRVSQQPCVFSELRVDDLARLGTVTSYSHGGILSTSPQTSSTEVLHERRARSFLITDETGTAEVRIDEVTDVSFVIAPHLSLKGRQLRAPAVANTLLSLGLPAFGKLVVTESAIFVGDTVTVAGIGMREVSPSVTTAGYREVPMRFVVRGGPTEMLALLKKRR
jgi:hypothetical protein